MFQNSSLLLQPLEARTLCAPVVIGCTYDPITDPEAINTILCLTTWQGIVNYYLKLVQRLKSNPELYWTADNPFKNGNPLGLSEPSCWSLEAVFAKSQATTAVLREEYESVVATVEHFDTFQSMIWKILIKQEIIEGIQPLNYPSI